MLVTDSCSSCTYRTYSVKLILAILTQPCGHGNDLVRLDVMREDKPISDLKEKKYPPIKTTCKPEIGLVHLIVETSAKPLLC